MERIQANSVAFGSAKDRWGFNYNIAQRNGVGKVQSVNIYMGNTREVVNMLPAGNIPALLGIDHAIAGETFSSIKKMCLHLNQSSMSLNQLLLLQ